MNTVLWISSYLVLINVIGFALMGIDKSRAKNHAWRISESALFIVALLFGSLGSVIGMQVFRHKTKHWYFRFGLPAMLVLHLALAVYFIWFR